MLPALQHATGFVKVTCEITLIGWHSPWAFMTCSFRDPFYSLYLLLSFFFFLLLHYLLFPLLLLLISSSPFFPAYYLSFSCWFNLLIFRIEHQEPAVYIYTFWPMTFGQPLPYRLFQPSKCFYLHIAKNISGQHSIIWGLLFMRGQVPGRYCSLPFAGGIKISIDNTTSFSISIDIQGSFTQLVLEGFFFLTCKRKY